MNDYSLPKGYTIDTVRKSLRHKNGVEDVVLYELTSKRNRIQKVFTTIDNLYKYINTFEREKLEKKALRVNGYQAVKGVAAMHKDMEAAGVLREQTEGWLSNQTQPKVDMNTWSWFVRDFHTVVNK